MPLDTVFRVITACLLAIRSAKKTKINNKKSLKQMMKEVHRARS